jgi:hypothetical protein
MKRYFVGLFRAQHQIQNKLAEYLQQTENMASDMEDAVGAYLKLDKDR